MKAFSSTETRPARPNAAPQRLAVIDAARGVAILAMIEWHAADAWLGGPARDGATFARMQIVGGLAAPAFVFLAGLSLALASPPRPELATTLTSARRGVRIALAGYALALFSWAVDHGGLLARGERAPIFAAAIGLVALAAATADGRRAIAVRAGLATAGLAAMHLAWSRHDAAGAPLARLDVLHGIGAALVATAIALHVTRSLPARARGLALGLAAVAVAVASGPMEGVPQRLLPTSIAAWIARDPGRGLAFPLFPWAAYALLGAATAIAVRARPLRSMDRWALPHAPRPRIVVAIAIAVAIVSWESGTVASVVIDRVEPLRGVLRLAFNVSMVVATCGAIAALGPTLPRAASGLALLGRRSLVVYCVHLELVYGLAGLPLRRALGVGGWALGVVVISVAMLVLARALDRASVRARERSDERVHAAA